MKMVFIAPRKYVQGPGVMAEIGSYLALLGKRPLLLWDAVVREVVSATVLQSVREAQLTPVEVTFQGEVTEEEAGRVGGIARSE